MSAELSVLPRDRSGPVDCQFEPFPEAALDGSVIDRFDAIAARYAERLAVGDESRSLNYSELSSLVDRIAAGVADVTGDRPGPVAILLQNEARYPAAMLGVLASGRAFVPLESDHPIERNRMIAAHAKAVALISAEHLVANAAALFPQDLAVIDIDRLAEDRPSPRPRRPKAEDLAYIIYTSGSTGAPKGVYQNHRGVLHEVRKCTNIADFGFQDRLALMNAPNLAVSVRLSLLGLLNGGSLHCLVPRGLTSAALANKVRALGITVMWLVPRLLGYIAEGLGPSEKLDTIRFINLAGDRADWRDFDVFRRACTPQARLRTGLGATECGGITHWIIDEHLRGTGQRLPVGRAFPDLTLTIVDDEGRPVADGDVGELHVCGCYIALGYWQDPELTARAFVIDPADPRRRAYKTGDLVLLRRDGLIEYIGRKDEQIKLHGHRIEPAEVESAIATLPLVSEAAVVVRTSAAGAPRTLVAYVVLRPDIRGLLPRHVQAMLAQRLPRHAVPAQIVLVGELPRLPNFKIDRVRLAQLDAAQTIEARDRIDDPLINDIARIFEAVIGAVGATPDDNVTSLGGDSLHAIKVALELENRFRVVIPPKLFNGMRTIRDLAQWMVSERLEVALVCELEVAYSSGAPPAIVKHASPYQWANACHDLFEAGRIDVCEYAARHLQAIYPDLTYIETLIGWFDAVPHHLPPPLTFSDNPEAEIQIVRRPGCDAVLLCFCAQRGTFGVPLNLAHQWLGRLSANLVYIKDFRDLAGGCGYPSLGPDRASTMMALLRIAKDLGGKRIYTVGVSLGGYPALYYGLELGAVAVLALAGETDLTPSFKQRFGSPSPLYRNILKQAPDYARNLHNAYARAPHSAHVLLAFSAGVARDREQAERMTTLPKAELIAVDGYSQHNVIDPLIRRGQFLGLLQRLLSFSPY